jgi:hypothetical protein
MPWFPILPDEVSAAEARLGIALPLGYRAIVGDPKYRALLAHPTVGAINLDTTMLDFVAHTVHRRATLPGFPANGVVAMEGAGRYIRFWLPDPKHPGRLGETVYAWDTIEGKRTKDASSLAILMSMIALVERADADATSTNREHTVPNAREAPRSKPFVAQEVSLPARTGTWTRCGTWELRGQYVTFTDLGEIPSRETPATVRLAAGTYRIDVRLVRRSERDDTMIAGWRLVRVDVGAATDMHDDPAIEGRVTTDTRFISEQIAMLDVDLGAIAVYDRQTFFARVRPDNRDAFVEALMEVTGPLSVLHLGDLAPVQIVRSGEGDGSYPVFALRSGGDVVGVAVHFIDAE